MTFSHLGAKPSEYGPVFGVAYLSAFVAAPVFGKLVSTRPKVIYYSGAFIQATLEAFLQSRKSLVGEGFKKYTSFKS